MAGRTGNRAVQLTIPSYTNGDRKLLQTESDQCAPAVVPGQTYDLSVWYQSTGTVSLTVFRLTPSGWSYWGDLAAAPATAGWVQAKATTPTIPDGTTRLVFGLSLANVGTLTVDDFSATKVGAGTDPVNLVVNPALANGPATGPDCFFVASYGSNSVAASYGAVAPPAAAPAGAKSFTLTMSGRTSGDAKLLQSEAAGCAPSVVAGGSYRLSVDYRSTSVANSLTVFSHTASGWGYWTDLAALPESDVWTTTTPTLPPIPTGVDRISFGISIAADGTLSTTGYSLTDTAPPSGPDAPATVGVWDVLTTQIPIRAIHTTLLNDGRLLLIAGSGNDGNQFAANTFRSVVWNPTSGDFTNVATPTDMFCAGHLTLPDGKVLIAGGTEAFPAQNQGPNTFKGSKVSYYFDPADNLFHKIADLTGAHWYPTLTKLGNGDVWAAGGLNEKAEGTVLTEMFDYASMSWKPQDQVPQTYSFWGTYPHMYLLQDGTLFYAGAHTFGNGLPGTGASLYRWQTAQITDVPGLREKDLRDQAGSVLLPPAQNQRVMIVGGGNTDSNAPGINLVDIIDLNQANPHYVPGPDLPGLGKGYVNVLNLPDRTVLAADGARYNRDGNVTTAALYSPVSNAWTPVAPDPVGRNYHSTAILLPDGRVVVLGSNPADNSFEMRISVYRPPYLFKGARPTVDVAPVNAGYGQAISLGVSADTTSASLMSPMSATHQTDTNARLVDLPLSGSGTMRTATVPTNPNLLPPGPYMLTVLNANGVPSVARWIWITTTSNAAVRAMARSTTSDQSSASQPSTVTPQTLVPASGVRADTSRQPGLKTAATATRPSPARVERTMGKSRADTTVKAVTQGRALGGCLPQYGKNGQCVPTVPPSMAEHLQAMKDAGMDTSTMSHPWSCAELRLSFPRGVEVRRPGKDPMRLDSNRDGIACGNGDRP